MPVTSHARGNFYGLAISQDDPTIGTNEDAVPVVKEPWINPETGRMSAQNTDVPLGDVIEALITNAHFTPALTAWCEHHDIDPNRLHEIGMATANLLRV